MSVKHLSTGSTCPPQAPGTLRMYSMRYCPFAQRTRLVLAHKKIPHELVNVNLQFKPEWFFDKNPVGLVPTLEQNGKCVYESGVCDEYLDEVYPQNKLTPEDPYEKAQMKILMERFGKVMAASQKVKTNQDAPDEYLPAYYEALQVFEDALTGTYFGGNKLNMLDLHIWPWMEKAAKWSVMWTLDLLPRDKFPKLRAWSDAMFETDAARGGGTDLTYYKEVMEEYKLFFSGSKEVKVDYDRGV